MALSHQVQKSFSNRANLHVKAENVSAYTIPSPPGPVSSRASPGLLLTDLTSDLLSSHGRLIKYIHFLAWYTNGPTEWLSRNFEFPWCLRGFGLFISPAGVHNFYRIFRMFSNNNSQASLHLKLNGFWHAFRSRSRCNLTVSTREPSDISMCSLCWLVFCQLDTSWS